MAYIEYTDLETALPPQFLAQALDDNGDGQPDMPVWERLRTAAQTAIDARLGQRYAVPLDPAPDVAKEAALVFSAELLYMRRGAAGEQNPWAARADAMRARLDRIGRGEEPLGPDHGRSQPSAAAITETAKTYSEQGNLPV